MRLALIIDAAAAATDTHLHTQAHTHTHTHTHTHAHTPVMTDKDIQTLGELNSYNTNMFTLFAFEFVALLPDLVPNTHTHTHRPAHTSH